VTPHVIVVGAGFGGLYLARALRSMPVRVTVIDRTNHHLFQPMLYQVATAALSAPDISQPIRSVLRTQRNAEVILGDERAVIPVGSYNPRFGTTVSLPSIVGRQGVIEVLEPEMSDSERQGLERGAARLKATVSKYLSR